MGRAWKDFEQDWLQAPQSQMGQDRLQRNFRTGWCTSQIGPVRAWKNFEQDWLQAPQNQVGPVRVWKNFEQDWLQAPQGQMGQGRSSKTFFTGGYKTQDSLDEQKTVIL